MSFTKANQATARRRRANKSTTSAVVASMDAHDEATRAAYGEHADAVARETGLRDLHVNGIVSQVPLSRLVRHPANRVPAQADVDALAASIEAHGLLDPITVRELRGGRLQVLSGETRWLGVAKLGWDSIAAREALDCSDSAALQLLAVANAQRKDLTVAQKALLIFRLSESVESGGAGLTRAAAGAVYGLSASAASNLVRLLDAPAEWLERIDHPERPVHQATVREIAKITACPAALADLERIWSDPHDWEWDDYRDGQVRLVRIVAAQNSRPLADGAEYWVDGKTLTWREKYEAGHTDDLTVVELPTGNDGAMERRATNCALWDHLASVGAKKDATNADGDDDGDGRASDRAESDAVRREKADAQLAKWIEPDWRPRMLRLAIAEALPSRPDVAQRMAPWLLCWAHCHYTEPVGEYLLEAAMTATRPVTPKVNRDVSRPSACRELLAKIESPDDFTRVMTSLAQSLLRPCDESGADVEHMPLIDYDELVGWARQFADDLLVRAWLDGAVDGSPERAMIAQFLSRHTTEQLLELSRRSKWPKSPGAKKGELIAELLAAHKPGSPLSPPDCCQMPREKRKRGAK